MSDPVVSFHAARLLSAIDAAHRLGQAMMIHTATGHRLCQLATMDRGSRWNAEKKASVFQGSLADELVDSGICQIDTYGTATIIRRKA